MMLKKAASFSSSPVTSAKTEAVASVAKRRRWLGDALVVSVGVDAAEGAASKAGLVRREPLTSPSGTSKTRRSAVGGARWGWSG